MRVRSTQVAPGMLAISAGGLLGAVGIAVWQPFDLVGNLVMEVVCTIVVVVGLVAARLTVTVDERTVSAAFGWGWPRRTIALDHVVGMARVRNRWWHGWGIRKIHNGWMFNNAGLDAVELELATGQVFRIGTERPEELLAAIGAALDSPQCQ